MQVLLHTVACFLMPSTALDPYLAKKIHDFVQTPADTAQSTAFSLQYHNDMKIRIFYGILD